VISSKTSNARSLLIDHVNSRRDALLSVFVALTLLTTFAPFVL
jgi:hypothetical protein